MKSVARTIGFSLCAALLYTGGAAHGVEFSGKVIAVLDGDTLLVLQENNPVKVRLAGIDAPELAQPFGEEARQSLAGLVMNRQVQVISRAIDVYGRMIADARIGNINLSHAQVRLGMAWESSRFHNNQELITLLREAQNARRGLWAGDEIIEPAQWRKLHPSHSATHAPIPATTEPLAPKPEPSCAKRFCSQMTDCDEARDYLTRCGIRTLDGDGNGVPCETLCVPR